MNKQKTGFTLIELFVVVLIIGILAAIAVPQYQKTVLRSRAAEALTNIRAIADAQQIYRLATGEWATGFAALDVTMCSGGNSCKAGKWFYNLDNANRTVRAYYDTDTADTARLTIGYRFEKTDSYPNFEAGDFACLPRGNAQWEAMCRNLAGPNGRTQSFSGGIGYVWR